MNLITVFMPINSVILDRQRNLSFLSAKDFTENLDIFFQTAEFHLLFKYNYLKGVSQSQQEAIFGICLSSYA